ncbi:uncharacterized protein N7483_011023 [Penicillium malachiteum]|uniref:uncharacterized protein n=1 Tax=Penicillium malachiteum TaxID=1324776 RepID=UPI0025469749|nr:uncharacterized protein N7483_011023 [Penicillium malachiteum]KAJ5713842.1 hypothetical protein N7483_011023 [Penicillium malachiteum]
MDSPSIEHPKEHLNESPSESILYDTEKLPSSNSDLSKESVDAQLKRSAWAEKAEAIRKACDSQDVEALAFHAISKGGLLEDGLRQIAWPILLQCEQDLGSLKPSNTLPKHADEEQVDLDVNRAFVYYPTDLSEEGIAEKKEQLLSLITQILRNYPMLCYFQGYHDIVQVFLLVMGSQHAALAMAQVSLFRIRDYMLRTLSPAIKHLQLIPAIIEAADPSLRQHLSHIQPFFALAATLTLYAHDIQEYSDIARLYDFLLAREPVVSIYLFAAMILSRKKELLNIPVDEPEMLHFTLSKLPQPLDLDGHILRAEQLFKDHPPESLPHGMWRNISRYSVLKTSRGPSQIYNVQEAIRLFEQQNRQIHNEERRKQALEFAWKHRRTMGSVTLAILVGAASFYLRKKGLDASIWAYIGRVQSFVSSFI